MTELKNLEGNYLVEVETRYDLTVTDKNYLMITVFGKSWSKK